MRLFIKREHYIIIILFQNKIYTAYFDEFRSQTSCCYVAEELFDSSAAQNGKLFLAFCKRFMEVEIFEVLDLLNNMYRVKVSL